jgi:SNF2 family DNA or RNA helicase
MEMRLGKTLVIIRWSKYIRLWKNLIIAPYSAIPGWIDELTLEGEDKWGIVELTGMRDARLKSFDESFDTNKWFLINKEGHLVLPEIADSYYHWDLVTVDESTCLKSHESQISKFFTDNFRKVPHRSILTGTPAPESELDYYMQCKFLDERIFNERDYWIFRNNNFGIINYNPLISPRGSKYIPERLAKYCFFLTRRDVHLGGLKIYEKRFVQMPPNIREVYNKICSEFLLEYAGEIKNATVYAPTQYVWMRRLFGGFVDGIFVFNQKLIELIYLLQTELKDQQVVIGCHFTEEIEWLSDELSSRGYKVGTIYGKIPPSDRTPIYRAFQNKIIDLLVIQPECFKYGVSLSCASTVLFYSTPEGGETRQQFEDRVIDLSKVDSSLILDLVVQDSIEEDILDNLVKKEGRQDLMRKMVQRIQRAMQNTKS